MSNPEVSTPNILFNIIHEDREINLELSKYQTVGELKAEIFYKLQIPPSDQIIDCWYQTPQDDHNVLEACCLNGSNFLIVRSSDSLATSNSSDSNNMEICEEFNQGDADLREKANLAALSFIQYFCNNFDDRGVVFHICTLEDAIFQACLTSLESRKILILYFHNHTDPFSKIFCENLVNPETKTLLSEKFFLLGWDVESEEFQDALKQALNDVMDLSNLVNFVESKTCAALLIVPIKDSITLFSCMRGKISENDFLSTLKQAEEFLVTENNAEQDLAGLDGQDESDIGSKNYQQLMLDLLGDRDYDSFDYDEHDLLKDKIGFALFGQPIDEKGYDKKQKKKIDSLYKIIIEQNNSIAKWKDRVVISFIYNCTEPLPKEKLKRAKKFEDYNPNTDLNPVPIFILRKCKNSPNPCRIFIDDIGRVYRSWPEYLRRNKLPECLMILPRSGRYQADRNGKVILEQHLSPACGIDTKILQGADIASTAAGLASGGVVLAAAIPAIAVAPVAVVAAGVTGLGVGLYAMGRSVYSLYDRSRHKESLSFANSEARGAYFNIVAGSLGFVGAGANMAVAQLATRGFNIGQGATAAVNVINITNLSVSGITVVNSGFDVVHQWWNENQAPTLLTIVQLSSSILFFGHAVYNFKMAGTIIEETQANTLKDYQDSLRSNKHRKTFNKLMKETISSHEGNVAKGQAEVIKTIRNIQNKDEVFAVLTRANKEMNKNDIKFSAEGGEIRLNGVSIDMTKFSGMDKVERISFLAQLSTNPEPTPIQVSEMTTRLQTSLEINTSELGHLAFSLVKIFGNVNDTVQDKIINAVAQLITYLAGTSSYMTTLDDLFPHHGKYFHLFRMVGNFFQQFVSVLEDQYQAWQATKDPTVEEPIFAKVAKLALDGSKRALEFFDYATQAYFIGTTLTESGLKELLNYFYAWLTKQVVAYEELSERRQRRSAHSSSIATKVSCGECGGVYYQPHK